MTVFGKTPSEVQLVYQVLRKTTNKGLMIDVGAHTGGSLRSFALNGWRIYAFEPDEENRALLEQTCRYFDNVIIDPHAVSDEIKTDLPFYRSNVSTGISGLSKFHPSHEKVGRVNTTTLDRYCIEYDIINIDFLKVDTEGFDLFVLKGVPWTRIYPRVIVCEFEDRKTVPLGYNYHDMANYLLDRNYKVLVSEWYPMVEYGTKHRWRRFAEYPTELADVKRGHGNLIATLNSCDTSELMKRARWCNVFSSLYQNFYSS